MADHEALLQDLGFTEYEARAYVALLRHNPLNGYELAKVSGLPRANVYAVLARLEERGAITRAEAPDGTRYSPVAPKEFLQRLEGRMHATLGAAEASLARIAEPAEQELIYNIRGYGALLENARTLVGASTRHLLVAVWPEESTVLAEDVRRARGRGVDITTLCLANCATECGGCAGHVHRYRVPPEQRNRWLILIPDGEELLAGEVDPETGSDEGALAVRTRQRLLVDMATWYIRHSVALGAVLSDLGGALEPRLSPRTKAILATVGTGERNGGWLEHMRHLMERGKH